MTSEDIKSIGILAEGDAIYCPHYETPTYIGDKNEYPLTLVSYKTMLNQEGRSANTPWAQEYFMALYDVAWENLAEINPKTAAKYNIEEGDLIKIESSIGSITLKAKLFEGIHPDIVAVAFGQGHFAYGRHAKNRGANPNEITGVDYDHITGMASYYNTRVKITKV